MDNNSMLRKTVLMIATSMIFVALIVSMFVSLSINSFSSALMSNITRSLQYRVADNADLLTREIRSLKKFIEGIALLNEIQSMDWEIQKSVLLPQREKLGVKRFQVADLNGETVSTTGVRLNISERDYFKRALQGETVLTDPITSIVYNELVVICATPIRNEDHQIVGVLTAALDSDFLFSIMDTRKEGMTGYVYLINGQGTIIAHPNHNLVLSQKNYIMSANEDPSLNKLVALHKKMIKGETGNGFYLYEGTEKFMTFTLVPDTGWSMALVVPRSEIFFEIDALRNRIILITAITVVVALLVSISIFLYLLQNKRFMLLEMDSNKNAKLLLESIELDRIKTEFFANVSHELRTPINVILATIQLLNQYIVTITTLDKEYFDKHFRNMKKNCLRLIRLVNNLIDTTKMDAGFFEVHLVNCNIVSVVEDLTMSVADYIKGKDIILQFDTDIEEKVIACDIEKVERIMLNLLSNAVKFTNQKGSIRVTIMDKGETVQIAVKDTGIGIPSDKREYIFERFRQVDKSLTRNHEGSGIGLSLVKSLVEMQGGKITVESTLGQGSEFIIHFPVNRVCETKDELRNEYMFDQSYYLDRLNMEFSDL